jgi:hypothetical protein
VFGVAARWFQALGSAGGVLAGGFQVSDGMGMLRNNGTEDDWVGGAQVAGGLGTISGSAIMGLAAVGIISAPLVIGAAPILLGAGAIAGAGALVYNALKDEGLGERLEGAANRPGGFSDTMIVAGRAVMSWLGGGD